MQLAEKLDLPAVRSRCLNFLNSGNGLALCFEPSSPTFVMKLLRLVHGLGRGSELRPLRELCTTAIRRAAAEGVLGPKGHNDGRSLVRELLRPGPPAAAADAADVDAEEHAEDVCDATVVASARTDGLAAMVDGLLIRTRSLEQARNALNDFCHSFS